jgi:murein DD-endopeptidase MepM/ murein hydrolase activator NlpD
MRSILKRRFLTLLILGHGHDRFRRVRVSYPFAMACLAMLVLAIAGSLSMPSLLLDSRDRDLELDWLQQENARLNAERQAFDEKMIQVGRRLQAFEAQASLLGRELGLDQLSGELAGGAGGQTQLGGRQRFWFEEELQGLAFRTEHLDASFDDLGQAFQERMELLAATPNLMPVEGWFSHGYGWRKDPFTGDREFHRGMDIVAQAGTPIIAPADGVVSRGGRFPQLGNSVDLAHGYGYVTRYAHMSEIKVKAGDRVRRGEVIGRVGSTGRSTGPHLHYEVFRDGKRVNPWKYLGL